MFTLKTILCAGLLFVLISAQLSAAETNAPIRISWAKNMLKLESAGIPGGILDVWYLEAFCRSGSTDRDWRETVIPHKTELVSADPDGHRLRLKTVVDPDIELVHDIIAGKDEVNFKVEAVNKGTEFADVQWFQPCMRVGIFTGLVQSNYHARCFILPVRV